MPDPGEADREVGLGDPGWLASMLAGCGLIVVNEDVGSRCPAANADVSFIPDDDFWRHETPPIRSVLVTPTQTA